MTADQSILPPGDDEIDLREVFAAMQRRWRWVLGGGLLGLALVAGLVSVKRSEAPLLTASLIVDTAQSPCWLIKRKASSWPDYSSLESACIGEYQTTRLLLNRLARDKFEEFSIKYGQFKYEVAPFVFSSNRRDKSETLIALSLTFPFELISDVSAALAHIKQKMEVEAVLKLENNSDGDYRPGWIVLEEPSEIDARDTSPRLLVLGLVGGLVVGSGSALLVDRRSNRVYSREELLRRLNYPLCLGLPTGPWITPAVPVLVAQLATQLDQSLSWRVLSIARQHEAVAPLTKLLQQQGGADFQCDSANPLLSAVLRFEPRDQQAGLLLVVEPGFNSVRALEEARLLISQMSNLQAVGIVLIGTPLPEELSSSVVG